MNKQFFTCKDQEPIRIDQILTFKASGPTVVFKMLPPSTTKVFKFESAAKAKEVEDRLKVSFGIELL
ncbi:TPA: hypothetical protein ACX6NV_000554 [Photobacterium damselae]